MSVELDSYWFVAAVFRDVGDLAGAIAELRARNVSVNRLLVVANHTAGHAREHLKQSSTVAVVAASSDGAVHAGDAQLGELPHELQALLDVMYDGASAVGPGDGAQVYGQLRQDVADGALVLIANVPNPDAQLLSARTLLRANCECVLTHEMAAARN